MNHQDVAEAVVRLSLLTGSTVGELFAMRPKDIYRRGDALPDKIDHLPDLKDLWVYVSPRSIRRFIILNRRCQEILRPYLDAVESPDAPIFPNPFSRKSSSNS